LINKGKIVFCRGGSQILARGWRIKEAIKEQAGRSIRERANGISEEERAMPH
jgi:hypothetical protein